MPRTVDHEQRRARIVAALIRVAAREGLHTVTMRRVASEAGISLGQVQHYFSSKARLMHAALEHLERASHGRWAARLVRLSDPPPPRAFLEAFVAEALPDDEESAVFHHLFTAFAVMAVTDPELAEQPFVTGPDRLEVQLTDVLRGAERDGLLVSSLGPATEAARLIALTHGLGTSMLVGQRTTSAAHDVVRRHLDQVFGAAADRAPEGRADRT